MSHYYFLASLPLLTPGKPPALTAEAFARAARAALPPNLADLAIAAARFPTHRENETTPAGDSHADAVTFGHAHPPGEHPFLVAWRDVEAQLVNAQAAQRLRRRGAEPGKGLPHEGCMLAVEAGVEQAFKANNPLERERALAALRFTLLDELTVQRPYGDEAALAYAVKFFHAQRLRAMDAEAGRERFRTLAEAAANAAFERQAQHATPSGGAHP